MDESTLNDTTDNTQDKSQENPTQKNPTKKNPTQKNSTPRNPAEDSSTQTIHENRRPLFASADSSHLRATTSLARPNQD